MNQKFLILHPKIKIFFRESKGLAKQQKGKLGIRQTTNQFEVRVFETLKLSPLFSPK